MKKKPLQNWDDFYSKPMIIPMFIYGRDDKPLGYLDGFCRGNGPIMGHEKAYQNTIGIYTAEGVYHSIMIDTRVEGCVPTFIIEGQQFFYPIVECSTVAGGLPVIDPATGNMRQP